MQGTRRLNYDSAKLRLSNAREAFQRWEKCEAQVRNKRLLRNAFHNKLKNGYFAKTGSGQIPLERSPQKVTFLQGVRFPHEAEVVRIWEDDPETARKKDVRKQKNKEAARRYRKFGTSAGYSAEAKAAASAGASSDV